MRKYWVLAIGWSEGVWPNDELWQIIAEKAGTMMLAGQLVLGTLGPRHLPLGRMNVTGTGRAAWVPDWRISWMKDIEFPTDWESLADSSRTSSTKHLRIFTNEAAALEFAEFVISYGALFAKVLTEEEVEALCPLPDDSYIDAMIVDPADTARIADLESKKISLEQMRYFRETGEFPPGLVQS